MTYVITRSCCSDAACVPTCPVNCIHPAPGEPGFGTSEMLYIDPDTCIECSACVQVCPVSAIAHEDDLSPESLPFIELNAAFYQQNPLDGFPDPSPTSRPQPAEGLRVAIVGSGPAGSYAAAELMKVPGVNVNVFERLMTPLGLVRYGVAPDHQETKAVAATFPYQRARPGLSMHFGVNIGQDLTHQDLLEFHHAVIYAVGAGDDRPMGVPGEHLPGSHSAAEFVSWYNGHPDFSDLTFDFSTPRAVVIGNGNVALDVARVLAAPIEELAKSDIADHAIEALRSSQIREVVVIGRRGPEDAAYSTSELIELTNRTDLAVGVDAADDVAANTAVETAPMRAMKVDKVAALADVESSSVGGETKQITLRYRLSPLELMGTEHLTGIRLRRNEIRLDEAGVTVAHPGNEEVEIETGLVLRSVGFRGKPIAGLPFDERTGTVPNEGGRVITDGDVGAYVTGWIKRGPRGVIGTNKACAAETVSSLLDDFKNDRLNSPSRDQSELEEVVAKRTGGFGLAAWSLIDTAEQEAGQATGRPRVKFSDSRSMVDTATPSLSTTSKQ